MMATREACLNVSIVLSGSYKNTDATNAVMLRPRSIGPRHRRAAKEAEEVSASHGAAPRVLRMR